jgi:hypothetical protein
MINFNNGVPAPEERETIEDLLQAKFTGTDNAGRFMLSFNDDPANKPTIDVINIDNLHEKYKYVAEHTQEQILIAHRITSPLLFGIQTANKGFSSNSEEMMTAFSILQTMTVSPFQNLILNSLDMAFTEVGFADTKLYFDQLTPLAILSAQAKETGKTTEQVSTDTNNELENPATTDDNQNQTTQDAIPPTTTPVIDKKPIQTSSAFFKKEYEIIKQ